MGSPSGRLPVPGKAREARAFDAFRDRVRGALGDSFVLVRELSRRPLPGVPAGEIGAEMRVLVLVSRRDIYVDERVDESAFEVTSAHGVPVLAIVATADDLGSPLGARLARGPGGGPVPGAAPQVEPAPAASARVARHLLERARAARRDGETLLARARAERLPDAALRGAALRLAHATEDAARALLAARGRDPEDDLGLLVALFDREIAATDLVSKTCAEALHRAWRAHLETRLGDVPSLYAARVEALREGAASVIGEVEIVLEKALPDVDAEAGTPAGEEEDSDET